jgi:hypothetical protein
MSSGGLRGICFVRLFGIPAGWNAEVPETTPIAYKRLVASRQIPIFSDNPQLLFSLNQYNNL